MKKILLKKFIIPEKFKIILTLFSFAVTQPLFDVLNKNQEFFVASNLSSLEVLIFVFFLTFIIPSLIYLINFLLIKIYKPIGIFYFSLIISSLFILFLMTVLSKFSFLSNVQLLLITFLLFCIFAFLYNKFEGFKKLITFLSISSILFLTIFLIENKLFVNKPKLFFNSEKNNNYNIENSYSIFIIIFDELPLNSLLDIEKNIDKVLFPNFSSLLNDFTWYKNATTVSDYTTESIPAILTGNYPKPNTLPTNNIYPDNIFNFLKNDYQIFADEPYTNLCPQNKCTSTQSKTTNWLKNILSDLYVIYKFLVVPNNFKNQLPFNNDKWNNFNQLSSDNNSHRDKQNNFTQRFLVRDKYFYSFLNKIDRTNKPSLYFHHIELPHFPFIFLPSGKIYRSDINDLGLTGSSWSDNGWLIKQSYQRHLLQVGFVDQLLGQFISKLKAENIYDESIIVIVADHGVSFKINEKRRELTSTNIQEIVSIPLFIKLANQKEGAISEYKVETIDILPTIFDAINIVKENEFDGKSLLEPNFFDDRRLVYFNYGKESILIDEEYLLKEQQLFLENKYTNQNLDSSDSKKIYKIAQYSELIGEKIIGYDVRESIENTFSVNQLNLYENINLSSRFIPSEISGYIFQKNNNNETSILLAIVINGIIEATTQTTLLEDGKIYWSAIVDEKRFTNGKNLIEIFQIIEENNELNFLKMKELINN